MKHKVKIAVISIFLALLIGLGAFLCVWFFAADYSEFDKRFKEDALVPGLDSGVSPQGLCALPGREDYAMAMSGYFSDKASRVYLFGGSREAKYITLKDENGQDISTHFGGIACTGNYLVIASEKRLIRVSLEAALNAESGSPVQIEDGFQIADFESIAYCYYWNGLLFAGEFYRSGNYETDQSHHIAVADGETNYGIVYVYRADESAADGVESTTPEYAISVRGQVQGIAVWEDGIALSTSYGLPDSRLWFYKNLLGGESQGTFNGAPLYILGSANQTAVVDTPCMSEEIFEKDGALYVLYESACKKYKYFVRRQIDHVMVYDIP